MGSLSFAIGNGAAAGAETARVHGEDITWLLQNRSTAVRAPGDPPWMTGGWPVDTFFLDDR